MDTRREPFLARYAWSAGVVLLPICLAPLVLLPYTSSGHALALVGVCTAVMSLIAAGFGLAGHSPNRQHLDLIARHAAFCAATLGLWTAIFAYAFFTNLTTG